MLYVGSRGAEPQGEAAAEWRAQQLGQGGALAQHRPLVPMVRRKAPQCTACAQEVPELVVRELSAATEAHKSSEGVSC